MEITGFLIVRNVARNGYPFVEATQSMMSLCRSVHILDGESTDATWDILLQLRDLCGARRLELHREPWREIAGEHPFRSATNQLLEKVDGEWLFNFQANEIVHEDGAPDILGLASRFPGADLFRLPYLHAMGAHYIFSTDSRGRLFRKLPHFESLGDAFDCGIDFRRIRARPWRLPWLLKKRRRIFSAPLDKPVFRMRAPCPESYVAKLESQSRLYPSDARCRAELAAATRAIELARKNGESVDAFWERIHIGRCTGDAAPPPGTAERVPVPDHRRVTGLPAALRHLAGRWKYDPRASLEIVASLGVPSPP